MENPSDTSPATQLEGAAASRQALYESAFALLSRPIVDPSPLAGMQLFAALRPRPEDYARAFVGEYAEQAQAAYSVMFATPRAIERSPHQTVLRLFMASAAELREKGPGPLGFPGGYADILDCLQPDTVWVHWKYAAPNASAGMAYDALCRIDDRWVLFPKPYRVLRKAAAAAPAVEPAKSEPAEPPKPPASIEPADEKGKDEEPSQAANIWKE